MNNSFDKFDIDALTAKAELIRKIYDGSKLADHAYDAAELLEAAVSRIRSLEYDAAAFQRALQEAQEQLAEVNQENYDPK